MGFSWNIGAFPVKVVDTTGAGDSFVGALLTKIVDGQFVLQDEAKRVQIFINLTHFIKLKF
ncbi:fructokinase-2 [Artemisia annua]|uniref:Fructokinase-2 n=1 Tax=Artemisia annua TaxID=35608 RepID=A0A2U1Q5J8_ARTAN|nr:fructokinase-2 [Artemisia annua]